MDQEAGDDRMLESLIDRAAEIARAVSDGRGEFHAADHQITDDPDVRERLASALGNRAITALNQGSEDVYLYAFAAWIQNPQNAQAMSNVFQACRYCGSWTGADFERVHQRIGGYLGDIAIGNVFRRDLADSRAETLYRMALDRYPDLPFAAARCAGLLVFQTRFEEAHTLFRQAAVPRLNRESNVLLAGPEFRAAMAEEPLTPPLAAGCYRGDEQETIVLFSCDSGYFGRYAESLVRSFLEHCTRPLIFHLHLINPTPDVETELERWRTTLFPGTDIRVSREWVDLSRTRVEKKVYYASSRFMQLGRMMAATSANILMVDADLRLLKDIGPLCDTVFAHHDVGMIAGSRVHHDLWNIYWADIMFITNTSRSRQLFERTGRYVAHFLKSGEAVWFLDQIAFYCVLEAGFLDEPRPRMLKFSYDLEIEGQEGRETPPNALGSYFWSYHTSLSS